MLINCEFKTMNFPTTREEFYGCSIKKQRIPEDEELKFHGNYKSTHTNNDVLVVWFSECCISKIPQGLTKIFPNLKILNIQNSNLRFLSKNDLVEYKYLERFLCGGNKIEYLFGNLFEDFKNLEWISFSGNKLKVIEPTLLDGLKNFKYVNFNDCDSYNLCFSVYSGHKSNIISLQELKNQLQEKYFLRFKGTSMARLCDINAYIQDKTFKDFKIILDDQEFFVHKFLLSARSSFVAGIMRDNPNSDYLTLVDIPVDTFKIILEFLYTDEILIDNGINFVHVFAAACRLEIKGLVNIAAAKIFDQINAENALEVLELSNKYGYDELRQKAFDEVKKNNQNIEFQNEWAKDTEKVSKMVAFFKKMNREFSEIME